MNGSGEVNGLNGHAHEMHSGIPEASAPVEVTGEVEMKGVLKKEPMRYHAIVEILEKEGEPYSEAVLSAKNQKELNRLVAQSKVKKVKQIFFGRPIKFAEQRSVAFE